MKAPTQLWTVSVQAVRVEFRANVKMTMTTAPVNVMSAPTAFALIPNLSKGSEDET